MLWQFLNILRSLMPRGNCRNFDEVTNVNPLTSLASWDACLQESKTHPVLVFKHSTACPISHEAFRHVVSYAEKAGEGDPQVYLVKVIEDRPVSNQIADQLQLQHKSPQLILLQDGAVKWSASHYGIYADAIQNAVSGRLPG